MIDLVLRGVLVAGNSLKTMTTNGLYQRIDYCMLISTQSLVSLATWQKKIVKTPNGNV